MAYQALVALNVPKFIYVRLSARVSLSFLGRLRRMVLRLLEDQSICAGNSGVQSGNDLARPTTILFIASNPPDTSRLHLDREVREIEAALRASGMRHRFRLEQAWAVGDRELQDSLLRYEPDVVHLSAHGTTTGRPILERTADIGELDQEALKTGDMASEEIHGLVQIFALTGQQVRCLVLNACHSSELAEALSPYVGCVIGMSESISDDAAIRFSWGFYNSLAYGRSVKDSFGLAVAQLGLAGYQESQIPQIYSGRSDPGAVVLVQSVKQQRSP